MGRTPGVHIGVMSLVVGYAIFEVRIIDISNYGVGQLLNANTYQSGSIEHAI